MSLVEKELPDHMSSPAVLVGFVFPVLCVCFVDSYLSICLFLLAIVLSVLLAIVLSVLLAIVLSVLLVIVLSVVLAIVLSVLLAIVLSVLLAIVLSVHPFTDSDYSFGIFKLFL
jgi:O-antigen ligase